MRAAVALLCAAAVVGACGGGAPAGQGGAPPAPAPATAAGDAITIERPVDGSRLPAHDTPGGRLRAAARVRGSAKAGSAVYLTASCRPARCEARATAGGDGRWAASVRLVTTRAARFVTIDASSQAGVSSTGSAVTTVELTAPQRRPRTAASGGSRARTTALPPAALQPRTLRHDVLVIGDSLAVGMADTLRAALPGWRVRVDGAISRPLATGMSILAAEPDVPAIVALSLFTNDDPSATRALEQAVRATATRPGGCAVWATIVRPPYNGISYDAANRVLEGLAADPKLSLRLVDWAGLVARSPSFVGGDGVHATPDGYRARGQLYAAAIRACAGER